MHKNLAMPLLIITAMAVAGCGEKAREYESVDVDMDICDVDSIPYSMFVDSISYLSLDPDNECLIGEVGNVAFLDSCMVVFESKTANIHLFDRNGKFLRDIGGKGAGNGEFIYPVQIDVDKDNKLVLVYDLPKGAVLKYSIDNVYLGKDSIGHASDMAYLGDGKYLATNYNDTPERSGVYLVDVSARSAEKILGCRDNVPVRKPWEIFRNGSRPSLMTRQYEDRLMEWNVDSLRSIISFNISPSPDKRDLSIIEENPHEKQKFPNRIMFLKNDRWFYSYYWLDDKIRYILYDGRKQKLTVTSSFYNDIDGIYGSELPHCVGNSFVSVVDGENEDCNPRLQFLHLKR